ncbi:MAG: shikimate dehydrogenase [Trueperella sp.]|nr:shikimate dehydrogenase [Trueperella sp.]
MLGDPVGHSLSPRIHNTSFAILGIDAVYLAHRVGAAELPTVLSGLQAAGYAGLNLTMPLKTTVLPLLDELTERAAQAQAVNTVIFSGESAIGDITDGAGMLTAIEKLTPIANAEITIFGTGGAARAIYTAAALHGAKRLNIFNRPKPEFPALREELAALRQSTNAEAELFSLADQQNLAAALTTSSVVINATAMGMGEQRDLSPVPAELISAAHVVADAVYQPRTTKLLAQARAAGAQTVDGVEMLIAQAALSEYSWLGVQMPVAKIRREIFGR